MKIISVHNKGNHEKEYVLLKAIGDGDIRVLEGSASVSKACELLKISWGQGHRIMENAVERGLKKCLDHLRQHEKRTPVSRGLWTNLN